MSIHSREHTEHMISVEEALDQILGMVPVLGLEERPILEALGQVLAEDITSSFDVPSLDNSAMDGYAVQFEDIRGASPERPRTLRVIGEIAAGYLPQQEVLPGMAIRIMTGAPIPAGADTVVPFEETDELQRKSRGQGLSEVAVLRELSQGANVRPAGEDVARGQIVLTRGAILRPAEVGVLATLGYPRVKVVRRPVVAVLATGDELLEPGEPLQPGKIYNSNSYGIAAAVIRYGGVPSILGIARDNVESLTSKLEEGMESDMVITSAGVSKGDYDVVKDVLAQRGEIAFWSVRMRPAKPLAFGLLRGPGGRSVPHVGLPGNPVSALVALEELVRPALAKMMGKVKLDRPTVSAVLLEPIQNRDGRRVFARVLVSHRDGKHYASLAGPQGSNILTSLVKSNGLAICPEDVPVVKAGEIVQVHMLDWGEGTA